MTAQRERAAGRAWTPGPWEVDGLYVTAGDPSTGATIADCWKSSRLSHVEKKANARLIAAAPELFEALEPLARIARLLDEDREKRTPDDEVVFRLPGYSAVTITMGECRKALAALSRSGEVEHG